MKKLILMTCVAFFLSTTCVFAVDQNQQSVAEQHVKSEKTNETKAKSVRCNNCPNKCLVAPNKTGKCGRYVNVDGELVPVEEK